MAIKQKVSIDNLADTIRQELVLFSQEIAEQIDLSGEKIGKEALKKLKDTSPKKSGKYAKAWTMTTDPQLVKPDNRILHVKAPHYRLTHLLEFGHALRGGGRSRAFPHIEKAEEEVIRTFTAAVEEAISRG